MKVQSLVGHQVGQDKVRFGDEVSLDIQNVLERCPTPDDIHAHLDEFNEEIIESHKRYIIDNKKADEEASKTIELAKQKLGLVAKEKPRALTKPKPVKVERASSKKIATNDSTITKKENKPIITQRIQPEETVMETNKDLSLDEELQQLEEKQLQEEAITNDPEALKKKVLEALGKLKDAPSTAQINRWKQEYGPDGVHVTTFSDREIYIYRHLTRAQWNKVQEVLNKMQSNKNVSEDDLKEKVVSHCILWPSLSVEWKYNSRAGLIDALYQAIMLHSYFLSPQQVMSLTLEI